MKNLKCSESELQQMLRAAYDNGWDDCEVESSKKIKALGKRRNKDQAWQKSDTNDTAKNLKKFFKIIP